MKTDQITIGIVTFRQRAEMVRQLISKIRSRVPDSTHVLLVVNNNNNVEMPEFYRKNMLQLATTYQNVYPIFCPQMMSLSKLWNTIVIFSKTEYNLILGDDVEFGDGGIYDRILSHINQTNQEFFTINHGFSHFVCTKTMLDKLNYFEERLCVLGNEDADMHHKHIEVTGQRIPTIHIPSLYNKATYYHKSENMETYVDNKPRLNIEIANLLYKETDRNDPHGIVNPMDPRPNAPPVKRVLENTRQYPHEMFVNKNRVNIENFKGIVL